MQVLTVGSFSSARSKMAWKPLASSLSESGGRDTLAWTAPLSMAASVLAAEPVGTMVTSCSGSSPTRRSPTRVAMSEEEPTLATPTRSPRSCSTLVTLWGTNSWNG
jgi:hypothetical protein